MLFKNYILSALFWNEIAEEVEPDPIYFEDDDPDEMPEHEREYKGYD